MRPEHVEAVQEWLYRAPIDDLSAERLLQGEPPLTETAAFHCQQLAEKVLEAYLVCNNRVFRRTHDLAELLKVCITLEASFRELSAVADALTPDIFTFRYPTGEAAPTLDEALQKLQWARRVQSFVLDRLPPEIRS